MEVCEEAVKGFQKGSFYDKYRPSYTDEATDKVIELIRSTDVSFQYVQQIQYDILELGAGTGKFTQKLVEKLKNGKVLATDPSEGFMEILRQNCPNTESLICAANKIPLPDNSVKVIICAQSFHWFANTKSLTEMERVLIPNGKIIILCVYEDWNNTFVKDVMTYVNGYRTQNCLAPIENMEWRNVLEESKSIQHDVVIRFEGEQIVGEMQMILNYLMSLSFLSILDEETKDKVRSGITEIIKKHKTNITFTTYIMLYAYQKT